MGDRRTRALVVIGDVLARQRGRATPTDLDRARAQEIYDALVEEAWVWVSERLCSDLDDLAAAVEAAGGPVLRAVPDERSAT